MPEIPDLTVYVEHLERRLVGERLERVRVTGWNLLRTADPALSEVALRRVIGVRRVGKRLVFMLEGGLLLEIGRAHV